MEKKGFVTLSAIPVSLKLTYTMTLLVLSVGYLFALVQTHDAHAMNDGKPSMSVTDLVIAYSGGHAETRLEAAIKGPMFNMLHVEDRADIINWVRDGATVGLFEKSVRPIITEHCIACHGGDDPHIPNLTSYENLRSMVHLDTGMDFKTLVRISHIHLFGLIFIFYLSSTIFCRAYWKNVWIKRTIIVLPFAAILTDIFSWYLTKINESFAVVVFASGGVLAACFMTQSSTSIYQMWFSRSGREVTV